MANQTYQQILATLTDEQAHAVCLALGQWAENAACRNDIEEEEVHEDTPILAHVETVVERLNGVLASLAD